MAGFSRGRCGTLPAGKGSAVHRRRVGKAFPYQSLLTLVLNFDNVRIKENRVPKTRVIFYRDEDGTTQLIEWLDGLPSKVQLKCLARIERLGDEGYALRRPEADFLRDKIYELRVGFNGINYRMLYFFHGNIAAVVSHGIVKEDKVPSKEIDKAIERMEKFQRNPDIHTYKEPPHEKN
jgi:hypothetical protein